jgi:hypothetical protein
MKNICKFLGIIAAVAVIGLVTGCGEPDAADRIDISISGLPTTANGFFAQIQIYTTAEYNKGKQNAVNSAISSALAPIAANTAKGEMVHSGKNFDDEGSYYVRLTVYETRVTAEVTPLYDGWTRANQGLIKGNNPLAIDLFDPPISEARFPEPPPATNYGTYTGTGYSATVTEKIVLQQTSFVVSDNSKPAGETPDSLTLRIDNWEIIPAASLPPEATSGGYTGGYKFTGKLTATTSGYIPSTQTAPNFVADDVKADGSGPDVWMSIYFKGDEGNITFIRTPFSKTGNVNAGVVKSNPVPPATVGEVRVYTKQP